MAKLFKAATAEQISNRHNGKKPECSACPYYDRTFVPSYRSTNKDIVVIGEAPGAQEAPIGDSGQLLRKTLAEVGFDVATINFTNTCRCHPPNNETPDKKAQKLCTKLFLFPELQEIKPKLVVLAGSTALNTFFPKENIMAQAGNFYEAQETMFLPVLHPAYCLRNSTSTPRLRKDLKKAYNFLYNEGDDKKKYIIVTTPELLSEARKALVVDAPGLITFDLETNEKLDVFDKDMVLWSVSYGLEDGRNYAIPLDHPENSNLEFREACWVLFKEVLATKAKKVSHNAGFDFKVLKKFKIPYSNFYADTMVMAFLLDENRYNLKLRQLASEYLDGCMYPWHKDMVKLCKHNAEDTYNTMGIFKIFEEELKKFPLMWELFVDLLMPMIEVIADMELNGVLIDAEASTNLANDLNRKLESIYEAIAEEYPIAKDVNFGSPKQLAELMFGALRYPKVKKTASGQQSTDSEVLEKLSKGGYKLATYLLKTRKYEKLLSTYVEKLPEIVKSDRRLHGNFNIVGTKTGRLSCVASWTPIVTKDGIKEIKDVVVGDMVWTHRGRWRKVTATQIKGIEPMLSLCFDDGYILTCTKSHKVLLSNGRWITIEEVANEYFKVLGGKELQRSLRTLSESRLCNDRGNKQGVQYNLPQYIGVFEEASSYGRIRSIEENSIFNIEEWKQESNERKDRRKTSQLDRLVRRSKRISNYCIQGQKAVCTPRCNVSGIGIGRTSRSILCSPYRWEPEEQLFRQFSVSYRFGPQTNTLFAGEGQPCRTIEKINFVGSYKVYDITVEEDHSYYSCGVFSHNSSGPNLQNIPRDKLVKSMFIASPGCMLLQADASQAELRVACSIADEPTMIEAYQNDEDLHRLTASNIFGVPLAKVSEEDRQKAKSCNFGFIYGASAEGYQYNAEKEYGLTLTLQECVNFRKKFFTTYPGFERWYDRSRAFVRKNGYVEYPTGRRARFPEVRGWSNIPDDVFRQSVNYPVQGSSSDILLFMMVRMAKVIKKYKLPVKMILTVHDSIVFDGPKDDLMTIAYEMNTTCLDDIPKRFSWMRVPMKFDYCLGHNWGKLDKIKI